MNKEGKKLLGNMKKHIPNFSSLGLQDLYENNQVYSEFLGYVLVNKLSNFVMDCLWEYCVSSGVLLWKWKRTLWVKSRMWWWLSTPREGGQRMWFELICYSFEQGFHCSFYPISDLCTQYKHVSGDRDNTINSSD